MSGFLARLLGDLMLPWVAIVPLPGALRTEALISALWTLRVGALVPVSGELRGMGLLGSQQGGALVPLLG